MNNVNFFVRPADDNIYGVDSDSSTYDQHDELLDDDRVSSPGLERGLERGLEPEPEPEPESDPEPILGVPDQVDALGCCGALNAVFRRRISCGVVRFTCLEVIIAITLIFALLTMIVELFFYGGFLVFFASATCVIIFLSSIIARRAYFLE